MNEKIRQAYTQQNARAIDKWVEGGWEWGRPITPDAYQAAKQGALEVLLTPQIPVPHAWFRPFLQQDGSLAGTKLLGLACGGAQQMPVFAARGAICTVLDYSESQLRSEREVSEREGYAIEIVRADMTKRLPFEDASFDMIFHPVANCYVEDVLHVWRECHRVLRPGGVLLAGMDNGINFLFDDTEQEPLVAVNKLPYNPLKDKALYERCSAVDGSVQFSHSLEEQLGGQLRAGLSITDLYEDRNRDDIIAKYCPQYIATRAIKP